MQIVSLQSPIPQSSELQLYLQQFLSSPNQDLMVLSPPPPPPIRIEEIFEEEEEQEFLFQSEESEREISAEIPFNEQTESDSETSEHPPPPVDPLTVNELKEKIKQTPGMLIEAMDLKSFVDDLSSSLETKSQSITTAIQSFIENEMKQRQARRQIAEKDLTLLYNKLNDHMDIILKNDKRTIELVQSLVSDALALSSTNRKHFDDHITELRTDRNSIISAISALSTKVETYQSINCNNFLEIQNFMKKIDSRLGDDDKKGEKEKEKEMEKEKEKQRQIQLKERQRQLQTLFQQQNLQIKEEQSEQLTHDPQLNPYNFLSLDLSNHFIHRDDRFKACVDLLSPQHRKLYEDLLKQRELFLLNEKKRIFREKYGSRQGMSETRVRDLLREISVPPPNPIWLFPFPHIKGTEISLSDPAPAPWPPTFNWGEHLKKIREEAAARERQIREESAARERARHPRR